MTANELRQKYLDFFKSKGHAIIPSVSLVPENDPSVLFTTAGMHPLVPYLLGEKHSSGNRIADVQKCIRTADIEEVGDNRHLTFFEMLGNWSFGDYFKKEAIEWSFEFLTDKNVGLGLDPQRLYVTVFKGEGGIPRDEDSIKFWKDNFKKAGMEVDVAKEDEIINGNVRIVPMGMKDNFWIAGESGPCGGDTEMFYDTNPTAGKAEGDFSTLITSGRLIEIWNNVFMEFNKKEDGTIEKLKQHNVDTGMGVERTLAILNEKENVFQTELFEPIFEKIEEISGWKYENMEQSMRIIADHIKAATFIISDGILPSNTQGGYVVRRLIRRAVRYGKQLGIEKKFTAELSEVVVEIYKDFYVELENNKNKIFEELNKEDEKFRQTLISAEKEEKREIENISEMGTGDKLKDKAIFNASVTASGLAAFKLETEKGFPHDMFFEDLEKTGEFSISYIEEGRNIYNNKILDHQNISRTASAGMFKGGLADASEATVKYHTAAHLMLAALRQILDPKINQKGSNITAERLRFDFDYPQKMTAEQIKNVEDLVNQKIKESLPVEMQEMSKEEALKNSRTSFDPSKYGDVVKVYTIGDFSSELCGGPHVQNTSELGHFKIAKEESSSAGIRRLKAILE
jgi:alanyl-tRNA synthetase